MAVRNAVVGFDQVMHNLETELTKVRGKSRDGLLEAGLQIEAVSNRRVPREHGNLAASSYARFTPEDPNTVEVGYGAGYAPFVHEATEEKLRGKPRPSGLGTYWNPGESKFLESAIEDNLFGIVEIVRRRAKLRGA